MEQASSVVITISRQLGSGGAYCGQQLSKNLNAFYADREIISKAAKQLSVMEEDLESRDERKSTFGRSFFRSYAMSMDVYHLPAQFVMPNDREVFKAESEIIEQIAKEGSAVIVGRCGSHILRRNPNHVSVFLHGNTAFRKGRIMELYKVTEKVAEKMITDSDKARRDYSHTFIGKDWTDLRQYDLSIDTSKFGLDESVQLIMKYLTLKGWITNE